MGAGLVRGGRVLNTPPQGASRAGMDTRGEYVCPRKYWNADQGAIAGFHPSAPLKIAEPEHPRRYKGSEVVALLTSVEKKSGNYEPFQLSKFQEIERHRQVASCTLP